MTPTVATRVAVAAAALLFAAGVAPAAAAVDRPDHRAGDRWTYSLFSEIEGGYVLNGTVTAEVVGTGPATVAGVSLDVLRVAVEGEGTILGVVNNATWGLVPFNGTWTMQGENLLERVGLHAIAATTDLEARATASVGVLTLDLYLFLYNRTERAVAENSWTFPLDVGRTGVVRFATTSTFASRLTAGTTVIEELNYTRAYEEAASLEAVKVAPASAPAGTFDALEVRRRWQDGGVEGLNYSAAVGNDVRRVAFDANGTKIGEMALLSFRFQSAEGWLGLPFLAWALLGVAAAAVAAFLLVGRRAHHETPVPTTTRLECPACGAAYAPGATECAQCGALLPSAEVR